MGYGLFVEHTASDSNGASTSWFGTANALIVLEFFSE
jgi:hypothetical protein